MDNQQGGRQNSNANEPIAYINILRLFSMTSVVFLHTLAGSLRGNIGSLPWHTANVLTAIMGTSVPIFFMISGALLLSSKKTLSIETTLKKRIPKMLIPLIVWSVVAVGYFNFKNVILSNFKDFSPVIQALKMIVSRPTTVHLWFMYALIPLYVISPILKKLVDALTANLAKYMIGGWLVFSSILPTIAALVPTKYRPLFVLNGDFNLNFLGGYLGYFLAGFYLFNYKKTFSKKLLLLIIAVDTLIICYGSWWKTTLLGTYNETFKSYTLLFTLILSFAIFLFVKEVFATLRLSVGTLSIIQALSALSFGVYLIHNLIVDYISRRISLWPAYSVYSLFYCVAIILALSHIIIIILASFKPTCYVFTGLSYKSACQTCNLQFLFRTSIQFIRKTFGSKD